MSYAAVMAGLAPAFWFRLAETAGTAAADAVGGAAGTYVNGPTLGGPGLLPADASLAPTFNSASSQYVRVADRAALDLGDQLTLVAWLNWQAVDVRNVFDKGSGAYIFRTDAAGRLLARRNSVQNIVTSTDAVVAGRTTFVAWTKAGATNRLFMADAVQGFRDVTGTVTNSTLVDNALELNIGASDAGFSDFISGVTDEPAGWNRALARAQLESLFLVGTRRRTLATTGVGT